MPTAETIRAYKARLDQIEAKKDALEGKRIDTLNAAVDMQLAAASLATNEAQRLVLKNPNDPRVAALKASAAAVSVTTNALKAMAATIAKQNAGNSGAVLDGHITNLNGLAAGPFTVQLFDGRGRALAQPVKTDATGYYAFNLDPATVKAIIAESTKLSISITIPGLGAPLAQTTVESSMIAAGKSASVDIALEDTELEKLGGLRSPAATAAATPAAATPPPATQTPATSTPSAAPAPSPFMPKVDPTRAPNLAPPTAAPAPVPKVEPAATPGPAAKPALPIEKAAPAPTTPASKKPLWPNRKDPNKP